MLKKFELTQSSLKDFEKLPRDQWTTKWINKVWPYERNESFIFGSLLDGFLFDPDCLPRKFITYKGNCKVTEAQQSVIGLAVQKLKNSDLRKALLDASEELNYGQTWKPDTLIKKFDGLDDYINFCYKNKTKTVLFPDIVKTTRKVARYLQQYSVSNVRNYILANPSEDYRNMFQQTLRGKIEGVPCKIILDILHFDEANSTVRDVDFKTTFSIDKFKESIDLYGYNTQLSFYQDILKQNPHIYEGYTLIEPMNVVVSKRDLEVHEQNYFGVELDYCKYGDSDRKGWLDTVKEVKAYLEELEYDSKRG